MDFDGQDSIQINNITALGKHGVTEAERAVAQTLEIDLCLQVDLRDAAKYDQLNETVNYSTVHKRVVEIVETRSCKLLENLAHEILTDLFSRELRILAARIRIAKPGRLKGATPSVVLVRSSPNFPEHFPLPFR